MLLRVRAGDDDVVRKVMGDLSANGASLSEEALRKKMGELLAEAKELVMKE